MAGQRANVKTGNEIIAKARYIGIFGLQFWREKPVNSNSNEGKPTNTNIERITS